jgi:hypothetical protein
LGAAQAANLISNIPQNYVENSVAIAAVIAKAERTGATAVEVTKDAEDAWIELISGVQRGLRGNSDCTPGYYNNEGKPMGRKEQLNSSGHPGGPIAFFEHLEAWRTSGAFEGLSFTQP